MSRLLNAAPGPAQATGHPAMIGGRAVFSLALAGFFLLLPLIALVVAGLALLAQLTITVLCSAFQFRNLSLPADPPKRLSSAPVRVFLSIHVPAHNEPPSVLIATLSALQAQITAPDHEVLVIVNNTADPSLWQPVAAWCAKAGQPFRFLRRDGVAGAKAGLLNIALQQSRPDTSHVVVVDADYRVGRDFLHGVVVQIARTGADFIQFPQAYRHLTGATEGLSFELADYFDRHARAANLAQAILLTGPLSVIGRDALVAVGGWPDDSGTEDAALGSRLIAAGYAGVFLDAVVGRGLMPLDIQGLHSQRHRWASGNARVLVSTARGWLAPGGRPSSALQKALVISKLAAGLNFGGLAVMTLLAGLAQLGLGLATPEQTQAIIALSLATLALTFGAAALPLLRRSAVRIAARARLDALVSRVAMLPVSALASLSGLLPTVQVFPVTRKDAAIRTGTGWTPTLTLTAMVALGIIGVAILIGDAAVGAFGALLLLPPLCGLASTQTLQCYSATVIAQER